MPQALIARGAEPVRRGPPHWAPCGFAADGRQLLLWSAEDRPCLRWWNLERREFGTAFGGAEDMGGHLLMQSGVSGDGTRVFQVGADWKLRIWDAAGGPPLLTLGLPASSLGLRSVSLSRDARWFAWSLLDGNQFWIADGARGLVRPLAGHRNEVNSVVFSPAGTELASASSDGSVRLWDSQTGVPLATLPGHPESANDVAFSPDGRTLASLGTYQSLKFWNLATHRELLTMGMPEAGSFLAFSPDGQRLAVTLGDLEHGDDRGARIFEAQPVPK
jgi:WD40 repeat protein